MGLVILERVPEFRRISPVGCACTTRGDAACGSIAWTCNRYLYASINQSFRAEKVLSVETSPFGEECS
jgi:hypothetical protein